jgi:[protein-PII] uridylyltransferase
VRASSGAAWTDWKGALLRELFERTAEVLETERRDVGRALEAIEARVDVRRRAARAELQALGVAEARIDEFFDQVPRRYFVSHTPPQIARHALALLRFSEGRPLVVQVRELRGDVTELIVWAHDVHGLYWRVAGTLTAHGVNILGSNVYTTRKGTALEVYRVTSPPGEPAERERLWSAFEQALGEVLAGRLAVEDLLRRRPRAFGAPATPARLPPSVEISSEESDFYTIIDVAADDRRGLLYALTRTLAEHDLEIFISKATTVLDQVADTFYVKDRAGRKLADPARLEALRAALLDAARGEAAPDG